MRSVAAILAKDFREYYSKAPTISWGILFPVTLVALFGYYSGGIGSHRITPSLLAVALMFSATTMPHVALSFDRMNRGLLLLLSSPVSLWEILAAKMLGGVLLGVLGVGIAVAVLTAIAGGVPFVHPLWALAGLLLGAVVFSAMGLLVSLLLDPVQAVAALNFLRFTMIFLGGMLPRAALPGALAGLAYLFPIAYIGDLFRYGLYNIHDYTTPLTALAASIVYAGSLIVAAGMVAERELIP